MIEVIIYGIGITIIAYILLPFWVYIIVKLSAMAWTRGTHETVRKIKIEDIKQTR